MNIFGNKLNCKTLFSSKDIQKKIINLGKQITTDYKDKQLVVFGLADGGLVFAIDLIRKIKLPLYYNTIVVKSYGIEYKSNLHPTIHYFPDIDLNNKHVLLVDDIIDSGTTLNFINDYIKQHYNNVLSIEYCALVNNIKNNKEGKIKPKYNLFESNGQWLIGYGLDDGYLYRNLNKIIYKEI